MQIATRRFVLRDFERADLAAFLSYQTDPRYRRLYDLDETYAERASELFCLFLSWRQEEPRRNYQLGIVERATGRLCGCAGLRREGASEDQASLGIDTAGEWARALEAGIGVLGLRGQQHHPGGPHVASHNPMP